jgi:CRISPR-associated protein Csm1
MSNELGLKAQVWQAALAGLLHDVGKFNQHAGVKLENSPRDNRVNELVELAAELSAGERADSPTPKGKPLQRLVTIFDRVTLPDVATNRYRAPIAKNYLPMQSLALEHETLFPQTDTSTHAQDDAYKALFRELASATRRDIADPPTHLENMLAAMQRTMWCVPSTVSDVSLYDHARTTAALAVCLADTDENVARDLGNKRRAGNAEWLDTPVALLIGGDISGLQDFIYTLTSKEAARTLRGRSFYLQLLGEALLRYVLRALGLPYTNVIYSGGGNFFLLAPVSAVEKLSMIRRAVAQKLLTHHGAALYLALGETVVPARGFQRGEFKKHWDAMHLELGKAKQQRYAELGEEIYARVFEPIAHGGNKDKTCAVCGDESESVKQIKDNESGEKICALCDSFGDLGRELTHHNFVVLGFSEPRDTKRRDAPSALRAFGMQFKFAEANQEIAFSEKPERAVAWAFDDLNEQEKFPTAQDTPTAQMMRYTVNQIPPFTFDELQAQSTGIPRLGVLRMDVDNLGDLFSKGFGDEKNNIATLSRIAALSFQMGLFFEGWVKQICAKQPKPVYAVYAGGDDVFLIAPWDIVPDLARKIAQDLKEYTASNPDVHLSAGMTFIGGKYPVYQAADDAHDALEQAKALNGKNAFSFLGQAWHWSEFDQVIAKFERLKELIQKQHAPEAILQTFRQFALDEATKSKRLKTKPVWGKWMWQGAYKLTRDAERIKGTVGDKLKAIRDELSANEYREIGQWGAAARWTQLWVREK